MNRLIPEIKICGITNLDDARAACEAGADYLGFVIYDKSPRAILPDALRRLREKLDKNIKCVGVFVNKPPLAVAQIAADCGLSVVQLCAEESYQEFSSLSVPIWRVIRIQNGLIQPPLSKWPACNTGHNTACPQSLRSKRCRRVGRPADRYVLDASKADLYGGTGEIADWDIAARLAKQYRIMLAGGLTPENVSNAVRIVRPAGVDAASGVERAPGKKDHKKIRFFIEAVRNACNDIPI